MTREPRGATRNLLLPVAAPALLTAAVACGGPPEDSTAVGGPAANQLPDGTENRGAIGRVRAGKNEPGHPQPTMGQMEPDPLPVPRDAGRAEVGYGSPGG